MKSPGWMILESIKPVPGKNEVEIMVRFRPQHPSILRELWRMAHVRPRILKPFVVLWGWRELCRGVRT